MASDGAAQPSCVAGGAEQPTEESYRRGPDGKFYTLSEFLDYYGRELGVRGGTARPHPVPQKLHSLLGGWSGAIGMGLFSKS